MFLATFDGVMLKIFLQIALVLSFSRLFSLPSFEEAMGPNYDPIQDRLAKRFQAHYDQLNFEKVKPSKKPLIPKIIHQIWIGGEVPERFISLMKTWEDKHPDWTYMLWTDETLKSYSIKNKRAFDLAYTYAGKADILRYELIEEFGGVYVDVDFECLKSLDPLVHAHSFFTAFGDHHYINNAIFGASAHHPIMQKLVSQIHLMPDAAFTNGSPWDCIGPKFFMQHVCRYLKRRFEGVIYPTLLFYPLPNTERGHYWKGELTREFLESLFLEDSFAVHYWAASWLDKVRG